MKNYIKPKAEAIDIDIQSTILSGSITISDDTPADPSVTVKSKGFDGLESLWSDEENEEEK